MQIKSTSEHYVQGYWNPRTKMLQVHPVGIDDPDNMRLSQKWQRYFSSAVNGGHHNPIACKIAARKLQEPSTSFNCFRPQISEPLSDAQCRAIINSPLARAQSMQKLLAFAPLMSTAAVRGWAECFIRHLPDEAYHPISLCSLMQLEDAHKGVLHPAEAEVIKATGFTSDTSRVSRRQTISAAAVRRGIEEAKRWAPHADALQAALERVLDCETVF